MRTLVKRLTVALTALVSLAPAVSAAGMPSMPAAGAAAASTMAQGMGNISLPVQPLSMSFRVVGAAASPPTGAGPGVVDTYRPLTGQVRVLPYATGGNSFTVAPAPGGNSVYVPTAQGTTYLQSLVTGKVLSSFPTIPGGRIARLSPDGKTLYVVSGTEVAAYATATHQVLATYPAGGNVFVLSPDGQTAYLAGNTAKTTTVLRLPDLTEVASIPVGQVGDATLTPSGQTLWEADMFTGTMTVVNTATHQVAKVIATPEGDPHLNLQDVMAAPVGFMQVAAGPKGQHVYATGFSGHILVFNTASLSLQKEIAVHANPVTGGPNKLSGLTTNGIGAVVTVENLKETVRINLHSGTILQTLPGVMSNRWAMIPDSSPAWSDISSLPAAVQTAIHDIGSLGVMHVQSNGGFDPRQVVSRGQFAVVMARALGLPGTSGNAFRDVSGSSSQAVAIDALAAKGILQGMGGGTYDPDAPMTRQEMAMAIARALGGTGNAAALSSLQASDAAMIAPWARSAVARVLVDGVVPPCAVGLWEPLKPVTRAQLAVAMLEMMTKRQRL